MGLVERGLSPVSWDTATAAPIWLDDNLVIALHWGNLLHPDPERNHEIVDRWADMLTAKAAGLDFILAEVIIWLPAGAKLRLISLPILDRKQIAPSLISRQYRGCRVLPESLLLK